MKLRPCGDVGLLVELEDLDAVLGLHAALRELALPGVVEQVPATRTLLLRIAPQETSVAAVRRAVQEVSWQPRDASAAGDPVEIEVTYDGEDLEEVAELTGLAVDEVIAAHIGQLWTVAFAGFAPGFGYLLGEDTRLEVPRREEPRREVPTGTVALAGSFSGIYPSASPGGWQLIGRTERRTWDLDRDPPALLEPGTVVRFVEAT